MKPLTQKELIIHFIEAHGEMIPAKMGGKTYLGQMFGSETSKRCRELRAAGKLISHGEGKFEVYCLPSSLPQRGREEASPVFQAALFSPAPGQLERGQYRNI